LPNATIPSATFQMQFYQPPLSAASIAQYDGTDPAIDWGKTSLV